MNFTYLTTFYSYKGGVGRTLALANVGAALARRGDGPVLLIDCDLEAPGLHRIEALKPPAGKAGGVLPWLAQLDPQAPLDDAHDALLFDAVYRPIKGLALDVLPASHGDGAARSYAKIDWRSWFASDPDTMISPLLQALRRALVKVQLRGYAYVLIDSRTGYSDLGGLMLFQLPHMAVIVSNYNDQNLGGLKPILQAMLPYTDRDKPPANSAMRGFFPPPAGQTADAHNLGTLERWLVFSPVPGDPELDALLGQRRERAQALLQAEVALGAYTEIPTVLSFQLQETLAVLDAPEGELAKRYREIAAQIESNRGERVRALSADVMAKPRRVEGIGDARGPATVADGRGFVGKPSTTAQGRTFEQRVAELLRLLDYEVSGETLRDGNRVDLTARKRRSLRPEYFVVECKDQKDAISKEQVERLWIWRESERKSVPHADGLFVTSGDYSPAARAVAEKHGLSLQTIKELQRELFDPEPYVQSWLQSYEGKREAQAYVAQQVFVADGSPATRKNVGDGDRAAMPNSSDNDSDLAADSDEFDGDGIDDDNNDASRIDLIPYALAWLGGETTKQRLPNRYWLLIGNYGTGKSTFTRRLTFELLRRRRAGEALPLPVLINLKERAGAPTLDNLLQEFLSEYRLSASVRQLRYGLEQGTAVLLLDSFDEMALAQYGRTLEQQLREFARLVLEFPDAKVLLTSRTHLFRSEQELERTVQARDGVAEPGSPLAATARELGASIQTLAPFTPEQIAAFIRNHATAERAQEILKFIDVTHKLSDLAPTAVLLEMIISGFERLRERQSNTEIVAAELYQVFVDEWLGKRAQLHAQLNKEQMTQWLEVLARLLWDAPGQRLHYQHLSDHIMARRDISAAIDPMRVDLELRTASFLTRNSAGDYGFSHRSFLEFFLARSLFRCLQSTRKMDTEPAAQALIAALPVERLSPESLHFFRDYANLACRDATMFWQHTARTVRQVLVEPRPVARSANALRMARECASEPAEWIPDNAQLAGADLSGEAWPLPLRGANLSDARLLGSRFWVADLSGATLARTDVGDADFSNACLLQVDARDLRGERTRFVRSDCRRAVFIGSRLPFADFRGAQLDDVDFARAVLCSARFRGTTRRGTRWDRADLRCVPYSERPTMMSLRAKQREEQRWPVTTRVRAAIRLSPRLLAASGDAGTIQIWDTVLGHCTAVVQGHEFAVTALAALDNGHFASGSLDHTIRLWNRSGQCVAVLRGHQNFITALAALGNGLLASGSHDNTIRLWDRSGQCTAILEGHEAAIRTLAALDDDYFASGSSDSTIRIWDRRGQCASILDGHGAVHALAALDEGHLASGSHEKAIRVWDHNSQCSAVLKGHKRAVTALAALSNGELASGSSDSTVRIWDRNGRCSAVLDVHGPVRALAALDDGQLASGSGDHAIRLWDHGGQCFGFLQGHGGSYFLGDGGSITTLAALNNGQLASGTWASTICLWESTGERATFLNGHRNRVTALAALDNGQLASGSWDKTIRLWDSSGHCTGILQGHRAGIATLAALDYGQLASGSWDNTIRLWDRDGQCAAVLDGHGAVIGALTALEDGQFASGSNDCTLRLWDRDGQCAAILQGHENFIVALATLDTGLLASGSRDGTIRIWERNGQCVAVLQGHEKSISALAALDNGFLASGSGDKTVRLWDRQGQETHSSCCLAPVRSLCVSGCLLIAGLSTGEILYFDIRPETLAQSKELRRVLAVRFKGDEQMLLYPDGAFWWPDRTDGLLPELADETIYRIVGSSIYDPDAAFPASAIAEERLPRPRTLEEILGPVPTTKRGRKRKA